MPDLSQPQYQDVRSLVLGGNVRPKKQAVYIEELGGWYNVQQLYANQKAAVLQAATNIKTKTADFNIISAGLAVASLRYPHPEAAPQEPVEPVAPPTIDENGEPRLVSPDEEEAYQEARQKYLKELADFAHPYPLDHPKAGELVFNPLDRDMVAQQLPSPVMDAISEPAMALSGMTKDKLEEKKDFFGRTVVDSTTTSSPTSSDAQTLTDSSAD
jgi:hypothetical protein